MFPDKQATVAIMPGDVNETEPDDHSMITFKKSVYDAWFTSTSNQIEDGDIIFFRKRCTPESEEQVQFPDVPSFLEYVKNRQIVNFRALERPMEDAFILELAKNHTYDDVVERVAQRLGLDDPSKIRLTSHDCYFKQPKPDPIKYRSGEKLMDMLVHYNQISYIMYYEVLDIPLPVLDLKTMEVSFYHAMKDEVVIHNVRLPKQSTVRDVLNEIKSKVELSHPNAQFRLLEVFYHKIYKVFNLNEKVEIVNDQYWTLRAEEIPEEEKNLGPDDRLVPVCHFRKDTSENQMHIQNFGNPFLLVIHRGESLAKVKVRIQKKLQVSDKEFSVWKLALLSLGRTEYLEDSDILSSRFQRRDVYGAWEQYLGLEHSHSGPKRAYAANQIRLSKEQEEEDKRQNKAQAHLYIVIKVAQDKDLQEQIGKDIYFDLVDHVKVQSFWIQKQMPFNLFKEEFAKEFGIPVEFQRFWIWMKRLNQTYRPYRPLTPEEEAKAVGQLKNKNDAELKLFLEVECGQDLHPVPPPDKSEEDILLFFKLYDPEKEELRYVGRLFVKSFDKPIEILTKLNELAGFAADEEIELFEEVKFEPDVMCVRLQMWDSFKSNEIEDGDIICFQKWPTPENKAQIRFPDVPSFLEYVKNHQNKHVYEKPVKNT